MAVPDFEAKARAIAMPQECDWCHKERTAEPEDYEAAILEQQEDEP